MAMNSVSTVQLIDAITDKLTTVIMEVLVTERGTFITLMSADNKTDYGSVAVEVVDGQGHIQVWEPQSPGDYTDFRFAGKEYEEGE